MGEQKIVDHNSAEYFSFSFSLDLYNSKSFPLAYRNIKLGIMYKRKMKYVGLSEGYINSFSDRIKFPKRIDVLNVPSKAMEHHNFNCFIGDDILDFVKENFVDLKFYLCVKSPILGLGRKFRIPKRLIVVLNPDSLEDLLQP